MSTSNKLTDVPLVHMIMWNTDVVVTKPTGPSSQVDHVNLSRVVWAVLSVVSSPSSAVRRVTVIMVAISMIMMPHLIMITVFTCKEEEEMTCL